MCVFCVNPVEKKMFESVHGWNCTLSNTQEIVSSVKQDYYRGCNINTGSKHDVNNKHGCCCDETQTNK